ncbi:NAD+ synthase [Pseudactinotalea sp. Z1739]|uniref:NAD+ synthase n=1 Tax=Pseudactinotalea sp. Z1739 TaxID=3413028 RepID=UPI003C7E7D93
MSALRVAMAQVNPTVGDLDGNAALVRAHTATAARQGATVVVFGEMALTGYPIEDLALRTSFREAAQAGATELARDLQADGLGEVAVVIGSLGSAPDGRPTNTALVLQHGGIEYTYTKQHLPNYGVFDEYRIFAPGTQAGIIRVGAHRLGLAICEDIWRDGNVIGDLAGADLAGLLVLNGSPYERGKTDQRAELVGRRAGELGCPVVYVNLIGGQDDLVFDGGSFAVDAGGQVLSRASMFREEVVTVELAGGPGQAVAPAGSDPDQMYQALVLGLGDYARKNNFASVVLGLSGGIDSALVAAIAADALGPEAVVGISMPSAYSSEHSRDDAADLAQRLGMPEQNFRTVGIADLFDAFQAQLRLEGVAEENLQARIRGLILMAVSNSEHHLVLAPGNKSELAVGYSTIYGDAVGGFAPIKDVSKSRVWELARYRNERARRDGQVEPIPENTITKEPSAELRPDQRDTDSLPDYAVLDAVLEAYVERNQSRARLVQEGFAVEVVDLVVRLVDQAEWKRRQYPLGPKVTSMAFGRDRRLPVTGGFREQAPG